MTDSVYIHIPFCKHICTYCDFCKMLYNEEYVIKYLVALNNEIKDKYNNEELETLYIGGGTPSALSPKSLLYLMNIIKIFKLKDIYEFTGKLLGDACANFAIFSSPEAFVFFGGLTKAGDLLMKPLQKSYDENILSSFKGHAKLLISGLKGSEAAVLGASALGWEI